MRSRVIRLLLRKELLDVFRDRKAIIMLVLVPLLIYPLIFFGSFAVMTMIQSSMEKGEYKVIVDTEDDGALMKQIAAYNTKKASDDKKSDEKKSDDMASDNSSEDTDIEQIEAVNLEKFLQDSDYKLTDDTLSTKLALVEDILQDEAADVYVMSEVDENGRITYITKYVSSITDSDYAETIIKDILDDLSEVETKEAIEAAGLDADEITHPFGIKRQNIASTEQSAGSLLGMILPFMLVVSLLMGTMYPAIDTTAGEKERGTLETLLTLPIRNHEMILAKFLTVALMGIISALLNIVSMGFMIFYLVKLVQSEAASSLGFDLKNFNFASFLPASLVTILAIMAFSLFISAVTMCITALAKSYKEANNYITPLTLVVMLTGYIGFIPNIELTNRMAMIPVANICLLVKNLLLFKADLGPTAIVLLTNVLYAGLAIMLLSRIYDSESVLFDEGRGGLQLFEKRSNIVAGGTPTTGDAWFIVFFVMIIYLYAGSILQMNYGLTGIFASQLIVLLIPLIMVIYTKRSIKKTYSFNLAKLTRTLGSVLLFIGAFLMENILSTMLYQFFPEAFEDTNSGLLELLGGDNIWIAFLVVAVTPAICEEMMFRGFILSGFRSKYRKWTSIVLSAFIFGVYHTSLIRLVPTMMLGICFAMIVYYTGSIFPAMAMHCLNNSIAVVEMYNPGWLEDNFPLIFGANDSVIASVIIGAISVVITFAGVRVLQMTSRGRSKVDRK